MSTTIAQVARLAPAFPRRELKIPEAERFSSEGTSLGGFHAPDHVVSGQVAEVKEVVSLTADRGWKSALDVEARSLAVLRRIP